MYVNELVIGEIRNNASAILQKFLFSCCKIEFASGKDPPRPMSYLVVLSTPKKTGPETPNVYNPSQMEWDIVGRNS